MYEQHFGISKKPFQLSPDPSFFFASNKHKQALSYLEYGLDQGEGFIVITGPIGTGKTILVQSLLNNIKHTNIEACQIVTSNLSPDDLLFIIAKELGVKTNSHAKSDLLQAIEQHLLFLNRQGKRALLLVDEAQNLPLDSVEELRMLSNFQHNNKPLLQSFLLGQEELKGIIQSPDMEQFRQRIIASCHLQAFNTEEIEQYICHRLILAEIQNPQIFTTDCFDLIQKMTQGIPRKINLLVDRILLFGFLTDLKSFTATNVQSVIDEMADELSAAMKSIHQVEELPENNNHAIDIGNIDNLENSIHKTLQQMDEYLTENIKQKVKMNRYLDKLLKQKNTKLMEHKKIP